MGQSKGLDPTGGTWPPCEPNPLRCNQVPSKKRIDSTVYHVCVPPTPQPRDPRIPEEDFTRATPFAKTQHQEMKPEVCTLSPGR